MCARLFIGIFPKHINHIPKYFPRRKELFSYKNMTKINGFLEFFAEKNEYIAYALKVPSKQLKCCSARNCSLMSYRSSEGRVLWMKLAPNLNVGIRNRRSNYKTFRVEKQFNPLLSIITHLLKKNSL